MDIVTFGDALLKTGDLDPVYTAVHKANLDRATLCRLVLAYWCFYHLGHAARLAEIKQPKKYWEVMMRSAVNEGANPDGSKPWPRGAERRHFRGEQAVLPMGELVQRYKDAESAVAGMIGNTPSWARRLTFRHVSASAQSHRGFGPWIAFKIADMSERVLGYDTDFTDCELGIYKDPRQGAALYKFGDYKHPISDAEVKAAFDTLVKELRKKRLKAPPAGDRLVNIQEAETVACKFKSFYKGGYWVGKDIHEIRHGLVGWGGLAQDLLASMPKEVPRQMELGV